jgi:hypothetical protein
VSAADADHERLRPSTPTTYYDGVEIPGYGDPPNRCRDHQPVGFCEVGHVVLGQSSCGTRYCPDHWRDWAEQAVINMVARLAAYRYVQPMGPEKRLCHVVASPPQDRRYSGRAMWDTRSEAYEELERAGVRGGSVVTHPYRLNERGENLYATAQEEGDLDEDTGKWRFLRDTTDGFEDLSRYVEASPHYHALAAVEDVDGEAASGDWVVKRIRTFDTFHPRDTECYRDMAATAYYVLTHGAVEDDRMTTTYFGDLAPASFNPEEELTASMWNTIQGEAEKAVKTTREEAQGGVGESEEECPHEECEATVRPLGELRERLDDDEWRAARDADQLARLRGTLVFYEGRSDRPPPSVVTSEKMLRNWLKDLGETHTPAPTQSHLPTGVYG